eukprot:CAMPEP_0170587934 /NCGR_PEP_ID=MMETSP0224-20130122/10554_1 /TAXON_ID=285029 /ORGANISM="Togula jolla, Strain CCCM 725" /LENGTH=70 /DNA_ID=CAMNT_0010911603 /DNA_START=248 /DNA_END=460 /DNA_ORIENTATION=-
MTLYQGCVVTRCPCASVVDGIIVAKVQYLVRLDGFPKPNRSLPTGSPEDFGVWLFHPDFTRDYEEAEVFV